MPSPAARLGYKLICFDAGGNPAPDNAIDEVVSTIARSKPSDVFVISHGWNASKIDAIASYDRWIATMTSAIEESPRDDFRPLIVAIHWPSKAFSHREESIAANTELAVDDYSTRLVPDADSNQRERVRQSISAILEENNYADPPSSATYIVGEAIESLVQEVGAGPITFTNQDEGTPTIFIGGDDWASVAEAPSGVAEQASIGIATAFAILRQLSFFIMRRRAIKLGDRGAADLLSRIRLAAPSAHIHLSGHSFGCLVVSGAVSHLTGAKVDTMFLVQGAVSMWAYSELEPFLKKPGPYRGLIGGSLVRGAIVATTSRYDYALGTYFPLALTISRNRDSYFQPAHADEALRLRLLDSATDQTQHGAVGHFGIRCGTEIQREVGDGTGHPFIAGGVYNMDCSSVINDIVTEPVPGAHSDINHIELARIFWAATAASVPPRVSAGSAG